MAELFLTSARSWSNSAKVPAFKALSFAGRLNVIVAMP